MALIDEKKLDAMAGADALGALDAVHEAVHEAVEERVAHRAARLRAATKTPKSQATREKIMATAAKIMSERSSTSFQMSEVSSMCNMSKGSLYYYFKDRDELVDAVLAGYSEELAQSIEDLAAQAPSAREALAAVASEIDRRLQLDGPLALALTNELTRVGAQGAPDAGGVVRITQVVAEQLERAKGEGDVRADVNCGLAASFITGGFLGALLMDGMGARAANKEDLVAHLFDFSLNGVAVGNRA